MKKTTVGFACNWVKLRLANGPEFLDKLMGDWCSQTGGSRSTLTRACNMLGCLKDTTRRISLPSPMASKKSKLSDISLAVEWLTSELSDMKEHNVYELYPKWRKEMGGTNWTLYDASIKLGCIKKRGPGRTWCLPRVCNEAVNESCQPSVVDRLKESLKTGPKNSLKLQKILNCSQEDLYKATKILNCVIINHGYKGRTIKLPSEVKIPEATFTPKVDVCGTPSIVSTWGTSDNIHFTQDVGEGWLYETRDKDGNVINSIYISKTKKNEATQKMA